MEAPEKIYIDVSLDSAWGMSERSYDNEVEYTRTDAFIEKAREFLSKESNIPLWESENWNFGCDTPKLVENFIKYMKGE